MVTDTPVRVLRAIVILPSRLDVAVVHRSLRQTSTCSGSRAQAMNLPTADYAWITRDSDLSDCGRVGDHSPRINGEVRVGTCNEVPTIRPGNLCIIIGTTRRLAVHISTARVKRHVLRQVGPGPDLLGRLFFCMPFVTWGFRKRNPMVYSIIQEPSSLCGLAGTTSSRVTLVQQCADLAPQFNWEKWLF